MEGNERGAAITCLTDRLCFSCQEIHRCALDLFRPVIRCDQDIRFSEKCQDVRAVKGDHDGRSSRRLRGVEDLHGDVAIQRLLPREPHVAVRALSDSGLLKKAVCYGNKSDIDKKKVLALFGNPAKMLFFLPRHYYTPLKKGFLDYMTSRIILR